MSASPMAADVAAPLVAGAERALRSVLFLATFFLMWLTAEPFPDLADPHLLDPVSSGNLLGQVLVLGLTGVLFVFLAREHSSLARATVTPFLIATLAWFALSALFSAHAGLAGRRLVLALCMLVCAAAFVLLPCGRAHFSRLLAVGAVAVLLLCYLGVALWPARSIHQATDLLNSGLVGDWRGPFGQKNGAGAAMAILVFIGLFVGRTQNALLGAAIVVASVVFLFFTAAKSSIMLLPATLVCAALILRLRSKAAKVGLALGLPLFLHLATIGSVAFPSVKDALGHVMPDATFTNRDQIWTFALAQIASRPIVGFGFQAFWGTSEVLAGSAESWVYGTSDAHNALLNLALMVGLVGTALALLWIVAQPLADLVRLGGRGDRPTVLLLVQIWLFGACLSAFESVLFAGGSGLWFLMIAAIAALRLQTRAALEP